VESVEIQEQTSDGTYGGLCEDGYVYNIEVEDNNNYFANGILVHNCQHCCGSPTRVTQFYKVVNSLYAPYKYGLTATPYRASDDLDVSMYALLGKIITNVDRNQVAGTTCPVKVECIHTGYIPDMNAALNGDGTIDYAGLTSDLISNAERFELVSNIINDRCYKYSMVLANRVEYITKLQQAYAGRAVCLSAKGSKRARKKALKKLNSGEIGCIFATYQLAAEGLDCPNLRYVVFATPEKNERIVTQSVGRVARKANGKVYGTVIDFVDDFGMYKSWAAKRKRYYKKIGAEI
jgi:superfamily II DNA or RNA helicase